MLDHAGPSEKRFKGGAAGETMLLLGRKCLWVYGTVPLPRSNCVTE